MASIHPALIYGALPSLSASVVATSLPLGARGGVLSAALEHGDHDYIFVSEDLFTARDGARVATFFEDWYFRIHLIPSRLDFGSFGEITLSNINVWNAYPSARTLLTVTEGVGDQGVSYLTAVPMEFTALQVRTVAFQADKLGVETITDTYSFAFDNGDIRALSVVGLRVAPPDVILFPYMPNWSTPVNVVQGWKTGIIESRSGREQRDAFRSYPRKIVEFSVVIKRTALADFRRLISRAARETFLVPERPYRTALSAPAAAGVTATVDEVPYWIAVDRWVVMRHGSQMSARQVKSIAGNVVTFWTNDQIEWPAGALVHPGLVCETGDSIQTTRLTSTTVQANVRFEVVPGSEEREDFGDAGETFDGREVFRFRPNWASTQSQELLRPSEVVDFEYGLRERFFPITFQSEVTQFAFVRKTPELATELRKFFGRMRGRQGEFYAPTWEADLVPHLPLVIGELTLRTEGAADALAFADNPVRRAVLIVLHDGTEIMRVVESVAFVSDSAGESSEFTMTTPWAATIQPSDIEKVCWLNLCRFASDDLNLSWVTNDVCQTQLSIQTLERLDAET